MGLTDRAHHKPEQLSGGQRQRMAIARAIIMRPRLLLADEPTGNLDTASGQQVIELLEELNARSGLTLIVVTHDPNVARRAERVLVLADGRIVERVRGRDLAGRRGARAMTGTDALRFSLRALLSHRLRSALSLLGMAIGVAAVVVLTALGEGARVYVVGEFANIGTNLIVVVPGRTQTQGALPGVGGTPHDLTLDDAAAVAKLRRVVRVAPVVIGTETVANGERRRQVAVMGATAEMGPDPAAWTWRAAASSLPARRGAERRSSSSARRRRASSSPARTRWASQYAWAARG